METPTTRTTSGDTLKSVFALLRTIIEDGVDHGFFECLVSCEVVNSNKRRLVIKAGKSHRFVISEDEMRRS